MKKYKLKKEIKLFLAFVYLAIVALMSYGSIYLFCYHLLNTLNEFGLVTSYTAQMLTKIISFIITFIIFLTSVRRLHLKKKSKFVSWFVINLSKIILVYSIILFLFVSLRADLIWDTDTLKDVISLQWTILGITIALFLAWYIANEKYLKSKGVSNTNFENLDDNKRYSYRKLNFSYLANQRITSVSFLSINVLLLILATGSFYFGENGVEINLLNQNLAILCFYFSTNSFLDLFLKIVYLLKDDSKDIMKKAEISLDDYTRVNKSELKKDDFSDDVEFLQEFAKVQEEFNQPFSARIFKKMSENTFLFDVIDESDDIEKAVVGEDNNEH